MRRARAARRNADRSAFAGFLFPPEAITVAVRWYLRDGLSYRDMEELPGERGVAVDHGTAYRWVQRFAPLFTGSCSRHALAGPIPETSFRNVLIEPPRAVRHRRMSRSAADADVAHPRPALVALLKAERSAVGPRPWPPRNPQVNAF